MLNMQQGKIHNVWHPVKIIGHAKRQENKNHNEKENQSIETDTEIM